MSDLIPLHAGSKVLVSKTKLIDIFDTEPHIYTERLANLLFGRHFTREFPGVVGDRSLRNPVNDPIQLLDQEKLASLVSKYL